MILVADERFHDERRLFTLRMHCEDCALFDDARDECAHGYPTAPHRRPDADETRVHFCKDFEAA